MFVEYFWTDVLVQEETSSILYKRTQSVYTVQSLLNISNIRKCHALQVCVVEGLISGWCVCVCSCVHAWCPSLGSRFSSRSLPVIRSCLSTMHMKQRPRNATDTGSWPPAATVVLWDQFANCILSLRRNLLLPSSGKKKSTLQWENQRGYWGGGTG